MANRVVMDAFSARDSVTYCIVTPWECRIATVIDAICMPLLTAAVANPRRRLWMVALPYPNTGAYSLSLFAMYAAVMGTTLPFFSCASSGLCIVNFSPTPNLSRTTIFSYSANDISW